MNHHLDQEVVAGFISEAKGYLPEIMLGLEAFAADAQQLASLKEAFRFSHIIKGAAAMLGFMQISEVAYQLEVTLEMLCEEQFPLTQELLENLCQNVEELALLLEGSLVDVPTAESGPSAAPEALAPAETALPAFSLPDFSLPAFSLTPTEELEETGATYLLEAPAAEEDVLPEAASAWSSYALTEVETEESFLSLLGETSFSVSLPETRETPTIGELDLNDVAKELKESFGVFPPPPQPEFHLPKELLVELPQFELATAAAEPLSNDIAPLEELPAENTPAENTATLETDLLEVAEDGVANVSFDDFADCLADDLLAAQTPAPALAAPSRSAPEDLQLCEAQPSAAQGALEAPAETLSEVLAEAPPAQLEPWPEMAFDQVLPDLMLLPELPALAQPETFAQQPFLTAFDEAVSAPASAAERVEVAAPSASFPIAETLSAEMSQELLETFMLEAEEHLQNLHTSFRALQKNPTNRDLLQQVRRSSHSLKGTAAMVGFDNIMQLAHRMEDVLDLVYDGEMRLTPEITLLLMQSTDALEDMSNGQTNAGELQQLYAEFARLLPDAAAAAIIEEAAPLAEEAAPLAFAPLPEMVATEPETEPELPTDLEVFGTTKPAAPAFVAEELETATTEELVVGELRVEPPAETVEFPEVSPEATLATIAAHDAEPLKESETGAAAQAGTMAQTSSQFVRVPIERLDEVVRFISEMIITRTAFEQRLADFAHQVEELQMTGARLRRASTNLEAKYEASTLGGGRPALLPGHVPVGFAALSSTSLMNSLVTHNTYGFDDLEFDRYTEFHLVSRELVESSSDIQTLGRELNHLNGDFLSYLNRQGRIYSELQDRLMRLRMVPLANIAPRLHRTVRTVSAQQHKQAELLIEGDATAIDTTALQEITDPLLHLLRNAVDHGIETPEQRAAKGKAECGKITLRAFYEGSQVVIQLRDDGQGLDVDKIRASAVWHGLLNTAEAESMSAPELWPLIFTPGFSTAEQVSEISGRGVGMDIVHAMVQKLKGTISIDSQPQVGTMFTIRLPLTLAVTRALMVKAHGQMLAVPLDVVTQIMRLEMSKIERIGKEPVVRLGGKVYPLLMLSRLLNMRQLSDEMSARPPALLLNVEGKEVVLIVDQLLGGREIVIKTLGNHLRKVHGVMGATLMGDGEVVLILNLAELLRGTVQTLLRRAPTGPVNTLVSEPSVQGKRPPATEEPGHTPAPRPKTDKQTLTIMIVDDSPSVRRVSSNLVKNVGWIPVLAKDGLDALDQLQASATPPDLILLDIEMPRMDGYQFLGSIRSLPAYRNLPVIIVTSRSSEKHRQKAFDLGATEYLVKPYQEDNVIALIRRLVKQNQP